jgi:rRNA-processing protein FCF1
MASPLRLREGVDPDHAIRVLRRLIDDAVNLLGAAGIEWYQVRDRYVQWIEQAESQLASITRDAGVIGSLLTDRHWQIRNQATKPIRPIPLVREELERQRENLADMADDLENRRQRLLSARGALTVVDTNVLLHYLPPQQIVWTEVLDQPQVRLLLPLRVIEELDAKKWGNNRRLAMRARQLLPQLDAVLQADGRPGTLRSGVTIEVALPPEPRDRPVDADSEILATCVEARRLSGRTVTVVSGDRAMRIRAQAHGLAVASLPDKYERPYDSDPAS